jgi:thymidylate synthase
MFGFVNFNKEIIADTISEKTGKTVKLGRMNWHADSYHIYGKDIQKAKELLFDRVDKLSIEERTFNFNDEFISEMFNGAEQLILNKIKNYDINH